MQNVQTINQRNYNKLNKQYETNPNFISLILYNIRFLQEERLTTKAYSRDNNYTLEPTLSEIIFSIAL